MDNYNFFEAIKSGDLTKVKRFIKKDPSIINMKAPDGWTPIRSAISHGQKEIAEFIVKQKVIFKK